MATEPIDPADLVTPEALAAELPATVTRNTLRTQVERRHRNGLASACVRVGRRVLISRTRYAAWLGSQAGKVAT